MDCCRVRGAHPSSYGCCGDSAAPPAGAGAGVWEGTAAGADDGAPDRARLRSICRLTTPGRRADWAIIRPWCLFAASERSWGPFPRRRACFAELDRLEPWLACFGFDSAAFSAVGVPAPACSAPAEAGAVSAAGAVAGAPGSSAQEFPHSARRAPNAQDKVAILQFTIDTPVLIEKALSKENVPRRAPIRTRRSAVGGTAKAGRGGGILADYPRRGNRQIDLGTRRLRNRERLPRRDIGFANSPSWNYCLECFLIKRAQHRVISDLDDIQTAESFRQAPEKSPPEIRVSMRVVLTKGRTSRTHPPRAIPCNASPNPN